MTIKQRSNKEIKQGSRSKRFRLPHKVLETLILLIVASGIVQAGQTGNEVISPNTNVDNQRIYSYSSETQTIEEVARSLTASTQSVTVINIENYVIQNFDYEFHWYPQSTNDTWESKIGDCTDRSLLIAEMLEDNGFEDVKTVHGYIYDGNQNKVRHDWVEVTIKVDGTGTFGYYEKVGDGVW